VLKGNHLVYEIVLLIPKISNLRYNYIFLKQF